MRGDGFGSGFLGGGSGAAVVGLALEPGVPEGREVVGHVFDAVGGVDFPVFGERGLGVRVVEETVCRWVNMWVLMLFVGGFI